MLSCEKNKGIAYLKKQEEKKMNELVRKTLEIEQHQCRSCGRLFYINTMDKSWLDLDFGCPYGCGDNGRHVRDIKTEVEQVKDVSPPKPERGDYYGKDKRFC